MNGDPNPPRLHIEVIYGPKSQSGLVKLRIGSHELQMMPARARALAVELHHHAVTAEHETLLVTFLTEKTGLDATDARSLLAEFRQLRDRSRPEA